MLLVAAVVVLATVVVSLWLSRPLSVPRVTHTAQITYDGRRKNSFVTDGARIFYDDGAGRIWQVSLKGGDPVPMPSGWDGMEPLDISSDGSELLLGQTRALITGGFRLCVASATGSVPRCFGDLSVDDACWSPRSDQIAYAKGSEIHIARLDGSELRKLAQVPGNISNPRWSPDGHKIRFTVVENYTGALWEVWPDGSHLHPVFSSWAGYGQAEGSWSMDRKYFAFTAFSGPVANAPGASIWAIRDRRGIFERVDPRPVQLTTGPMKAVNPHITPDGRHILVFGVSSRGELVRYDTLSSQWFPLLAGLSATELDYSRDRKWLRAC